MQGARPCQGRGRAALASRDRAQTCAPPKGCAGAAEKVPQNRPRSKCVNGRSRKAVLGKTAARSQATGVESDKKSAGKCGSIFLEVQGGPCRKGSGVCGAPRTWVRGKINSLLEQSDMNLMMCEGKYGEAYVTPERKASAKSTVTRQGEAAQTSPREILRKWKRIFLTFSFEKTGNALCSCRSRVRRGATDNRGEKRK